MQHKNAEGTPADSLQPWEGRGGFSSLETTDHPPSLLRRRSVRFQDSYRQWNGVYELRDKARIAAWLNSSP